MNFQTFEPNLKKNMVGKWVGSAHPLQSEKEKPSETFDGFSFITISFHRIKCTTPSKATSSPVISLPFTLYT
jgi:hypothetical protein